MSPDSFYDLGIIPLLTIRVAICLKSFTVHLSLLLKHLAFLCSLSLLSFRKSDVTPTVSDLWGLKYAYLGQAAYQHSVIAVAVKGMLVEQILCENRT